MIFLILIIFNNKVEFSTKDIQIEILFCDQFWHALLIIFYFLIKL